jgi:YVTN family beta-propeller protein
MKLTIKRILLIGLLVLIPSAAYGVHRWTQAHKREKTGRADVSDVSCMTCHSKARAASRQPSEQRYPTPVALAASPDGRRIYASCEGTDEIAVIDPELGRIVSRFATGRRPYGLAVSTDGSKVFVAIREENRVAAYSTDDGRELASVSVGRFPGGLAMDPSGKTIVVANLGSDSISIIDADPLAERVRLAGGREPFAVSISADGGRAYVANRLAPVGHADRPPVAELTVIDLKENAVIDRPGADSGHLAEGVAVAPTSGVAAVSLIRVRNLVPILQVARGWVMSTTLGVLVPGKDELVQFPLDDLNGYYADPAGVLIDEPRGRAFVASGGGDCISVLNWRKIEELARDADAKAGGPWADDLAASEQYVIDRIPVHSNPKAVLLSPDGKRLYVAERLADSVAVFDADTLALDRRIELGRGEAPNLLRRGEILFHSAAVTFQGEFSCRSCHPDGHQDGLTYDFAIDGLGSNLVDNRSLLGLADTEPLKWAGTNKSVNEQCGPRFAKVLTMADPFPPEQIEALAAYIMSLPPPAPQRAAGGELTANQKRGKAIFERTQKKDGSEIAVDHRCTTCHMPPLFTNRLRSGVGTPGPGFEEGLFDTPHLLGVGDSAPYLHDGRARTLEEIWTVHSPKDTHGVVNDLTKEQLNDLVEYLKSL